ncbi:TIGR01906 family membrane protein [Neomicrococcus lactis]|uniref:Integral membrane protein (TIGR01906 family) n=1 Tax=Neomicrococcus lactis TaxID=732241 RepID=A0A7W8YB57_9MICC|nr:TIGR01906 family membrane protein [Neomicrococcus lactis]MBB5598271.1 integral membrane protein (TIGR01906 family) [Neomicrococcus lactis]
MSENLFEPNKTERIPRGEDSFGATRWNPVEAAKNYGTEDQESRSLSHHNSEEDFDGDTQASANTLMARSDDVILRDPSKSVGARFLQVILAVLFPALVLIGAVRAVATPWFAWAIYNRPGFPADEFGFTNEERLTYGNYGVDYLSNSAGEEYLGGLVDSNLNPLFLNTEVSHMVDVKNVLLPVFFGGLGLFIIAVLVMFALKSVAPGGVRRGLFAGSIITLVGIIALAAVAILNWDAFFTGVHQLFFKDGTWTFNYSDTLIRLYPPQFWVDAGIGVGALVLLTCLITLLATWPSRRRREHDRMVTQLKAERYATE